MASLTPIRASNALLTIANAPKTAVFVGGTDGIGKAALAELVFTGFPVKIYIIGRDHVRHQPLVAKLQEIDSNAELIYLEGQISLMADCKRLADEISRREQQIDLLYLSSGYLPMTGYKESAEGRELSLAVSYFSRIVFINRLLPRLRAAADANTARIVSVLEAGKESTSLFLDDLELREPGRCIIPNYVAHAATMSTVALKHLADQANNQGVVFVHAHPGVVPTNLVPKSLGIAENAAAPSMGPQGDFVRLTLEESAQCSLFLMTSSEFGGKGVPLPEGRKAAHAMNNLASGSLFCVSDSLESLQQEELLAELQGSGAEETIVNYTQEVLRSYLS